MTYRIGDRIQETCSTPGTSSFAIGVSIPADFLGFGSIPSIATGDIVEYVANDAVGNVWELGIGTFNSGANTLARTKVLNNSSGTTALINFANNASVFCAKSAETIKWGGFTFDSGFWYAPPAAILTYPTGGAYLFVTPIIVPHPVVITKIAAVGSGTTGSGSATLTMGIYADNGSHVPGTLLVAGAASTYTISAGGTITSTFGTPQLLTAGINWLAFGSSASASIYGIQGTVQYGPQELLSRLGTSSPIGALTGGATVYPPGGFYNGALWVSPWTLPSTCPSLTASSGIPLVSIFTQ